MKQQLVLISVSKLVGQASGERLFLKTGSETLASLGIQSNEIAAIHELEL